MLTLLARDSGLLDPSDPIAQKCSQPARTRNGDRMNDRG